jgi:hypothetical protein
MERAMHGRRAPRTSFEDTCVSYEENTCMSYEEEDTRLQTSTTDELETKVAFSKKLGGVIIALHAAVCYVKKKRKKL